MNNILAQMNGKPLKNYQYKDHGSLVSLSNFSTVGSLMGNLTRGSMMIEGRIARFVYIRCTECTRLRCMVTLKPD